MNEKQIIRAIGDLPQDLLADAALPKHRAIRDSFISMTAGYKWMWAAAVALCIGLNIYAIRGVAQSLQAGWEHGEPSVTSAGNAPMTTSAYTGKEGPKISFAGMQLEEAERLAAAEGITVAAEHAASLEPKGTVIAERSNFDGSYWLTVSDGAVSVKQVNTIVSLEFACAEDPGFDSSTGLMLTDDAHNYIFGVTRCSAEEGSNPHVGFNYEMLRYISGKLCLYRLQYAGRDNIPAVTGCIGTISMDQSEGIIRAEADSVLNWQVQDMIRQLDFVNSPEKMGVRLESIHGLQAVDRQLHGVPFIDYLNIEACYQGFLKQKDKGRVEAMARIMYRDENGDMPEAMPLDAAEVTGTLFWYYYIKSTFAAYFPNFFKPANGEVGDKFNVLEAFNTQLRALTDGDVTKEEIVKQMDCWRCLTELDAKAREAADFKKRYGNKR